jgi:hypothetical protein
VGDEDLRAEGARVLLDAVGHLSGDDMDRLLRALPAPVAAELVRELIGNKLDPRRLKKPGALLVGALRKRPAARLAVIVERLSTGILGTFQMELGDRFDDPSLDALREVLDAVVAQHPAAGVRCTLSWVVAEGMPAAEAARDLLLSDGRLSLPGWTDAS